MENVAIVDVVDIKRYIQRSARGESLPVIVVVVVDGAVVVLLVYC